MKRIGAVLLLAVIVYNINVNSNTTFICCKVTHFLLLLEFVTITETTEAGFAFSGR